MVNKIIVFIVFLLIGGVSATKVHIQTHEVMGFLPYWLISKADKNYSNYISTLTYFGLAIESDGTVKKLNNPQEEEPGWINVKNIPKFSGNKSLLVVSGDNDVIANLINNPQTSAANLIKDVAPIMKEKHFTDLNLDIETFADASESSRAAFTEFVQEVKNNMEKNNLGTLSLDLIPIALVTEKLFDPKALGAIVDRIILMTYDYHYSGSYITGPVAPIGGVPEVREFDVETAIREAIKVIPPEKILMGIPLYGYQWETIENASSSATIPGGASSASVRRVAELLAECATCSAQFDPVAESPYLIFKNGEIYNQIYYENEFSMQEKINLAKKYNLAGVALWALGYEDDTLLNPLTDYKKNVKIY